jgi:hypothetical protein
LCKRVRQADAGSGGVRWFREGNFLVFGLV